VGASALRVAPPPLSRTPTWGCPQPGMAISVLFPPTHEWHGPEWMLSVFPSLARKEEQGKEVLSYPILLHPPRARYPRIHIRLLKIHIRHRCLQHLHHPYTFSKIKSQKTAPPSSPKKCVVFVHLFMLCSLASNRSHPSPPRPRPRRPKSPRSGPGPGPHDADETPSASGPSWHGPDAPTHPSLSPCPAAAPLARHQGPVPATRAAATTRSTRRAGCSRSG
jgi:hypothetical protein